MAESVTNASLFSAFPICLRPDVAIVGDLIQCSSSTHRGIHVVIRGERLSIPYRIHHNADETLFARLDATQALVYACVLTQHHDGHVRQRQIGRLAMSSEPWVAPFVVQLCGEYVIEILQTVESWLPSMHQSTYAAFFLEHPLFFQKTQDRMVSYWDCYHRWLYKQRRDYVGFRLFERFREWSAAAQRLSTSTLPQRH
jgi:hypothetical protein